MSRLKVCAIDFPAGRCQAFSLSTRGLSLGLQKCSPIYIIKFKESQSWLLSPPATPTPSPIHTPSNLTLRKLPTHPDVLRTTVSESDQCDQAREVPLCALTANSMVTNYTFKVTPTGCPLPNVPALGALK